MERTEGFDINKNDIFIFIMFVIIVIILVYARRVPRCNKYIPNIIKRKYKHVYDKKEYEVDTLVLNQVPAVIYQVNEINYVTPNLEKVIVINSEINDRFEFQYFDNNARRQFIIDNYDSSVIKAYDSLKNYNYKINLWKYCILYKNGGIYMDRQYKIIEPLISILTKYNTVFVKDKDGVSSSLIITPPKLNVFNLLINEMVENVEKEIDFSESDPEGSILFEKILIESEYDKNIKLVKTNKQYTDEIRDIETNEIFFVAYPEYVIEKFIL